MDPGVEARTCRVALLHPPGVDPSGVITRIHGGPPDTARWQMRVLRVGGVAWRIVYHAYELPVEATATSVVARAQTVFLVYDPSEPASLVELGAGVAALRETCVYGIDRGVFVVTPAALPASPEAARVFASDAGGLAYAFSGDALRNAIEDRLPWAKARTIRVAAEPAAGRGRC